MSLLFVFLFIFFSPNSVFSIKSNYPTCVSEIVEIDEDHRNFNSKFIGLTNFLAYRFDDQNGDLTKRNIYVDPQIIQKIANNWKVTFVTFSILSILIIILRIKTSKVYKLRILVPQNSNTVINPFFSVVLLLIFIFSLALLTTIQTLPQFSQTAQCQFLKLKSQVMNGTNKKSDNWSGLYGLNKAIKYRIKYLQRIQNLPNGTLESAKYLDRMMKKGKNFMQNGIQAVDGAQLIVENNTITIEKLLPQLFSTYVEKLNDSITILANITNLSLSLQNSLLDCSQTANDSITQLLQKQQFYQQITNFMSDSPLWSQKNILKENDLLIIKIFVALGLQISFIFLCVILVNSIQKYRKYVRKMQLNFGNFLWGCMIVLLLLGIPTMALLYSLTSQHNYYCPVFSQLLTNQTSFPLIFAQDTTLNANLHQLFQPCFYSTSTKFINYPQDQQNSLSIVNLMKIFEEYIKTMSILKVARKQSQMVNAFTYSKVYNETLLYIKQQMQNVKQNWQYLDSLLSSLNQNTLDNVTYCYKHRWVFNKVHCQKGQDIEIISDSLQLLLGNQSSSVYDSTKIKCISFAIQSQFGQFQRIANFSEVFSMYTKNRNNTVCSTLIQNIQNSLLEITSFLKQKYSFLYPIYKQLESQRTYLNKILSILRSFYLIKIPQYSHIHNLTASSIQNSRIWSYSTSKHQNCSTIKTTSFSLFYTICNKMRSDILKIYILVIIMQVLIGFAIGLGVVWGWSQQINLLQRQMPQYGEAGSGWNLNKSSQGSKSQNNNDNEQKIQ